MMEKFWTLLQESTIVQGILTLGVVGVWGYLLFAGQPIPAELNQIVGLVIGFYFGGKFVQAVERTRRV
jgi:hypothetical protein